MFQTKFVEKIKTHFVFPNFVFQKSCGLSDNVEKFYTAGQSTDGNVIRCVRTACWIPKATNTRSDYVILIAFPLRQWSHERALMLRYTYVACIVER